jgi:chaperonin GroES
MRKIQPVANYVLIDQSAAFGEKTPGGIIIPDSAKEKPQQGIVVALSPEATNQIVVGDTVIYKQYSGTQVSHEGKDYLLLQDADILAKYVEADEI